MLFQQESVKPPVRLILWRTMSLPAPPDNNHTRIGVHAHISLPDWQSKEAVIAQCPTIEHRS